MNEAVLTIHDDNDAIFPQGQIVYVFGKPVFFANISEKKFIDIDAEKCLGIDSEILSSLLKKLGNIQVMYRFKGLALIYITTLKDFLLFGKSLDMGGHRQYFLPLKHWKREFREIHGRRKLPYLDVKFWVELEQLPLFQIL